MGIDRDADMALDALDNCPEVSNAAQTNTDGDSEGNACDLDDDNDGLLDVVETGTGTFVSASDTGSLSFVADTDGDGILDGEEVANGWNPNNASSPNVTEVPIFNTQGWILWVTVLAGFGFWTSLRLRPRIR